MYWVGNTERDHRTDQSAVDQLIFFMPSVPLFRHAFAGIAGLTLLLFGQSMEAQTSACQSYEAAFNLEPGIRDG